MSEVVSYSMSQFRRILYVVPEGPPADAVLARRTFLIISAAEKDMGSHRGGGGGVTNLRVLGSFASGIGGPVGCVTGGRVSPICGLRLRRVVHICPGVGGVLRTGADRALEAPRMEPFFSMWNCALSAAASRGSSEKGVWVGVGLR